jgi:hypothetical protein
MHGSVSVLNKAYADYRARKLRLQESGPLGPSVETARGIEDLVAVCREVGLTWPADKVAE